MSDVLFFIAVAAGLAGQFFDSYTTEVALNHNWTETSAASAWVVKQVGVTGLTILKCAGLGISAPMIIYIAGSPLTATIIGFFSAGVGFYAGIKNYIALKKAKIL